MATENISKTIFIGGISKQVQHEDLKDAFRSFGKINNIKVKGDYAFIEFDHVEDADASVKDMDGQRICGHKISVQKSYGGRKERNKGPGGGDVCFNCGNTGHW